MRRFRPVSRATGRGFADWLRALRGRAGRYEIRDARTHRVLYRGTSESCLYSTVTRHFFRWRGATAGERFDRARVEVLAVTSRKSVRELAQELAAGLLERSLRKLSPAELEQLAQRAFAEGA